MPPESHDCVIQCLQMGSPTRDSVRAPFKDLTNNITQGNTDQLYICTSGYQTTNYIVTAVERLSCVTQQTPTDPKERRRLRDRERYANMEQSEKDEKNKKRREAYHRKKTAPYVQIHEAQPEATPGVLTQLNNTSTSNGEIEHESLISITKKNDLLF